MTDVAAAIIAGGAARRFGGRVKAHIRVDGERIIDRQLAVLRPRFASIAIIADDPEPYAELGLPVLPDEVSGQGPLAGLVTALAWAPAPRLFAVACDLPFLAAQPLERLLAWPRAAGALAVAPRTARGAEPLHAVYETAALPLLRRRLARGERKLASLLEALGAVLVSCDALAADPRFLINVNSEADLKNALG